MYLSVLPNRDQYLRDQYLRGRWAGIMSGYSSEVLLATSFLCSSGGALPLLQLHRKLLQRCSITEEEFCFIIQRCPRFLLVPGPAGGGGERLEDCTVVAKTSLRLCSRYGRDECGGSGRGECQQLHLCKFFIYGNCRFGKGRWATRTRSGVSVLRSENNKFPEYRIWFRRGCGQKLVFVECVFCRRRDLISLHLFIRTQVVSSRLQASVVR